ncbi:MAG: hypothetical protein L6Q35_10250 [Phycisphaerales bacterium]|nr:hypothetical protein [Phycisphaerales bacterium]
MPEYLSVAGQWCLVVTRVMPLPHPLHHGVWVGSKEIDPNEEVFDEFPDVFSITAQAIGFMMAMKQPPVSPEGRAIDAPQADSARTPLIPQPLAPMTDLQQAIWDALEGKAMTEKELRKLLEPGSEVRPAIARIKAGGRRIENRRGAGYFRPDAPPPDRG